MKIGGIFGQLASSISTEVEEEIWQDILDDDERPDGVELVGETECEEEYFREAGASSLVAFLVRVRRFCGHQDIQADKFVLDKSLLDQFFGKQASHLDSDWEDGDLGPGNSAFTFLWKKNKAKVHFNLG